MPTKCENIRLWAVTAHYFESDRPHESQKLPNLNRMLDHLRKLRTQHTRITIFSNNHFDCPGSEVIETEEKPGQWLMPWAHKSLLQEFLDSDHTHFMYLEDDMEITQTNMDYWLDTQDLFDRNGLGFTPGFHRIEKTPAGVPLSMDASARLKVRARPCITVEGQTFVSLLQPYQAMYIMDRVMAQRHISSRYFHRGEHCPEKPLAQDPEQEQKHHLTRLLHYGYPESATLGNMFVDVPDGFTHTYLHPTVGFDRTWVYHNLDKYIDAGVPEGHPYWRPQAKEFLDFS